MIQIPFSQLNQRDIDKYAHIRRITCTQARAMLGLHMPHNTSKESVGVTFHLQTSANHSPGKSNNVFGQPSQESFRCRR